MNKFKMMLLAAGLVAAACSKENGSDIPVGELSAPKVTVNVDVASISASWKGVKGADGYRCEVTYVSGGRNVDVLKVNVSETSFTAEALRPSTKYTVRVAATKDGKASPNWFTEEVQTGNFNSEVSFDITPYEVYNTTTGHIDYMAKVKPSKDNVYYWIGAVPYSQQVDAKLWIEDEISDAVESGATWEALVESGYIVKGDAESVFAFTGKDEFLFTAAILEHVGSQINVVSDVSVSYPFYAENAENQVSVPCEYKDYVGEWVVKPYDESVYGNSGWSLDDAESFTVKIAANESGRSYNLTGWGGSKNKYSSSPIVLDFSQPDDYRYEYFKITVPQTIANENGVEWAYTGWLSLTQTDADGNEEVKAYAPYDYDYDNIATSVDAGGWGYAFRGYFTNMNKTVMKIFANTYKYEGMNVYMQGLWVCGMDDAGKYHFDDTAYSMNGNRGGIPNAMYYLVRKDVAEGLELPVPDISAELSNTSASSTSVVSAKSAYSRVR